MQTIENMIRMALENQCCRDSPVSEHDHSRPDLILSGTGVVRTGIQQEPGIHVHELVIGSTLGIINRIIQEHMDKTADVHLRS